MKDWTGNYNSTIKTIGAHNGIEEPREEHDYYATDPKAIDKLLTVEKPNHNIWECAAGQGHLSNRLKELGFNVISSDLINRGGVELDAVKDFLKSDRLDLYSYDILTNPPYKFAKEFVLKALDLVENDSKVFMFLKLTFLEGKTRLKEIFNKYPPKIIYVFAERLMCAKNGEFTKYNNKGNAYGAVAYAWYVWQKGWQGDTTIKWI